MRESVKEFERTLKGKLGENILFVPDMKIFEFSAPADYVARFRSENGMSKDDQVSVSLPLIGVSGVNFENILSQTVPIETKEVGPRYGERNTDATKSHMANGKDGEQELTGKTLGLIALDFVECNCVLYFHICPTLEFQSSQSLNVVDNRGGTSPSVCINKQETKRILKYYVAKGLDHVAESIGQNNYGRIRGLVVDITGLWGMGGEGDRLDITCFCNECEASYEKKGIDVADFRKTPNPCDLTMKIGNDGIGIISDIYSHDSPASLADKAVVRGFGDAFKKYDAKHFAAEKVLEFMNAKHEIVEDFLLEIFGEAYVGEEETKISKIVISDGTQYDWSAGVFLSSIKNTVVDELWLGPTDTSIVTELNYKVFLWTRSTYFLNNFFEALSNAADRRMRGITGFGRLRENEVVELLRKRGAQTIGHKLGIEQKVILASGSSENNCTGFVTVAFSEETLDQILEHPKILPGLHDLGNNDEREG